MMQSNIQIVADAEAHAHMILTSDESTVSFSVMVATRQRAAKLLQEQAKIIRQMWASGWDGKDNPEKPKLPDFDEWYTAKYGVSFARDQPLNITTQEYVKSLSVYLGDYVSAMVKLRT